jgi:hypothetical protein
MQLGEQQQLPSLRVVSCALAILTAVRRRGTAVALEQRSQDGVGPDIVLFTRNFLRRAPVCRRLRMAAPQHRALPAMYDYADEEDFSSSGSEAD